MWQELAVALSLVMVIEGLMPFISPRRWREVILNVAQSNDRQIRIIGLLSMLSGLALLYWVR
ncbi:hypothetical protein FHR99_002795 [Litorivivens lipolytica]|uniref:DUF2065 domain-containing protein n=1 Tax=Litorivivens lipolytica TaxID=1524264 RepID=A0A7W4W6R8_9GAMM|nr:DUF2065 domain-containing protein [Litorivivens lipolytica]MBB3048521.1 hypothetical protein [Litorivivens lipolytica]